MAETVKSTGLQLTVEDIQRVLKEALKVPKWWLAIALPVAALSCFNFGYDQTGWSFGFAVTAVTAAVVAAVWLPSLISLISLVGGSAKTPAGEFASGGLFAALSALSPATMREAIPAVVAALDTEEGRRITSGNPTAKRERNSLEQRLDSLPVDSEQALGELAMLAREYEHLRESMRPGQDRTYQMSLVVTRARALGRKAGLGMDQINRLLDGSEGERLVGIGVAQGRPEQADITRLLGVVTDSRSAFEQYAALEALRRAAPQASAEIQANVATALRAELERPGTRLNRDSDRYRIARSILTALEA